MHRIMARPIPMAASRQQRQLPVLRLRLRLRLRGAAYATTASKQPGPTSQFYKTFTRPIAKVLTLAVFTYQFLYWGWVKLEADEHQQRTDDILLDGRSGNQVKGQDDCG
ncbi:hypothetical protein E4U41_006497 [Claviceps citrina]|nr:hypothetical protein E4U41_006497 [Claviceps citrina]